MKFKKVLVFLLAAALIFSAFTVSVGAETVEKFEVGVKLESTAIYKPGDNVTVTISADQNTGMCPMLYFATISSLYVPLPEPGAPKMIMFFIR